MKQLLKSLVLATLCGAAVAASAAENRPNILIILADDLGFSDISCFGSEIQTPNIDRLAAHGLSFTQFYNNARCCPTRASILTGLYPHQAGVGHMMVDRGFPGYRSNLNKECVTIAQVMKSAGYRTYACGKWHVTRFDGPKDDNSNWPLQRGFDKFYGTIKGYGNFYDPSSLCRQNTYITPQNDPEYKPASYYYTEALTDNAIRFLQQHKTESPDKPFFMYLAYTAAHWPMQAPERNIAKYKGKYSNGFEPLREARYERLKKLGIIDAGWECSATVESWDKIRHKAWESRCMEVYAGMIDNMDEGIGRVREQLERSGLLNNTVIFYLSDNGACAEDMGRRGPSPAPEDPKPMAPDALQDRIRVPMQTRDGRPVRTGPGVMPGPADSYVAYGRAWANVSNTPFREYKHWTYEGGISTPLIVHWPAGIPSARQGKLEKQQIGHVVDLMATCVDLGHAAYPKEFDGHKIKPMQGISLAPALSSGTAARKLPLFWEHEGNRAVRDGKWKLVASENQPWELYDMEKDRTELHNLAAANPDRVKKMAAQWDDWAARSDVLPLGAWKEKQ